MCVDVGHVYIEEADNQLQNQNKTLQHDFLSCNLYYHNVIKLSLE